MPSCRSCGAETALLRGGDCKACHRLFLAARDGDTAAARTYLDRGGTLPATLLDRLGPLARPDDTGAAETPWVDMVVTTESHLPGTAKRLGVVSGECALGMNIFRDFTSEVRDIFGGRSGAYQKAVKEARETCIREMKAEAAELRADAVVAMDLDFVEITGGGQVFGGKSMIMAVATGTAVSLAGETDA